MPRLSRQSMYMEPPLTLTIADHVYRHWQLRSLIGTPGDGLVYYTSKHNVYRLDTIAGEREIIATLAFEPRGLVTDRGWIWCGGDKGDVAILRVDPPGDGDTIPAGSAHADPDSRLPLSLESAISRRNSPSRLAPTRNRGFGHLVIEKTLKLGDALINCVTLWFPTPDRPQDAYVRPVAVVSSNNKSVTIVDLEAGSTLEQLFVETEVNRSIISPDGRLLIAIGDDPYLRIYHRKLKGFTPKGLREYGWAKLQQIRLPGPQNTENVHVNMKGSFAAAFSPSGRYLAAGTQCGYISVYETSYLMMPDSDPLLTTWSSTRPLKQPGAIRDMAFSPEPYDLLAWTEEDGKVVVADMRHNFLSRQVIILDPKAEGLMNVRVHDRTNDLIIDPRLRQFRIDPDSNSDSYATEMERRGLRTYSRDQLDTLHNPLRITAEEVAVLEAIRVSRRQRDSSAAVGQAQANATHATTGIWSDLVDDLRSVRREMASINAGNASTSTPTDDNTRPNSLTFGTSRTTSGSSSVLPTYSLRDLVAGSALRNETLHAFINNRNEERERRGQRPQRRGSVILATAGNALDRDRDLQDQVDSMRDYISASASASTSATTILTPPTTVGSTVSLNAPSIRTPTTVGSTTSLNPNPYAASAGAGATRSDSPTTTNPWAEIEALYNLAVDPPPVDPTARLRIELAHENRRDNARRQEARLARLEAYMHRPRFEYGDVGGGIVGSTRGGTGEREREPNMERPEATTGVCWSADGRVL